MEQHNMSPLNNDLLKRARYNKFALKLLFVSLRNQFIVFPAKIDQLCRLLLEPLGLVQGLFSLLTEETTAV